MKWPCGIVSMPTGRRPLRPSEARVPPALPARPTASGDPSVPETRTCAFAGCSGSMPARLASTTESTRLTRESATKAADGLYKNSFENQEIDILEKLGIFRLLWRKVMWKRIEAEKISALMRSHFDLALYYQSKDVKYNSINPLNSFGKKCFSQTDEDGITIEILRRMNCLANGVYVEIGVGDGMENNTLILAALGWKGCWIGGESLKPSIKSSATAHFCYLRNWVTLHNILALATEGLRNIDSTSADVISLDLDGNDIYFAEALLSGKLTPKLFIVEYNAKFPPPVEFSIDYDAGHRWQGDDYFGASLASFVKLFARFGYKLVCCNAHSGANAFFVQNQFIDAFRDVPLDIGSIYMEPRYLMYHQYGHKGSVRTIEMILNKPSTVGPAKPENLHEAQKIQ
jgi:hypothetical protein